MSMNETAQAPVASFNIPCNLGDEEKDSSSNRMREQLKDLIRSGLREQGVSVSAFATQQGVRRQYMYRILSARENVASVDQLMNYASDLGFDMSVKVLRSAVSDQHAETA